MASSTTDVAVKAGGGAGDQSSLNRRSISIFSRRGADTPQPINGAAKDKRPRLWVQIPNSGNIIRHNAISTVVQPKPRRPMRIEATRNVVSKFALPRPQCTSSKSTKKVSSEASDVTQPKVSTEQPKASATSNVDGNRSDHPHRPSNSSTSSGSTGESVESKASRQSSSTSVETTGSSGKYTKKQFERPSSLNAIIPAPRVDDDTDTQSKSSDVNKPLPPIPPRAMRHSAPVPARSPVTVTQDDGKKLHVTKSMRSLPTHERLLKHTRSSRSMSQLDLCDQEFMRSSPYPRKISSIASPTLSQAEKDLRNQLSTINAEDENSGTTSKAINNPPSESEHSEESVQRACSVHSVMNPPERAPTIPKRSRKREWRSSLKPRRPNFQTPERRKSDWQVPVLKPAGKIHRSASAIALVTMNAAQPHPITESEQATAEESVPDAPGQEDPAEIECPSTPDSLSSESEISMPGTSAEDVLLGILSALHSTEDLSNTAMVNKGMYRVYKENEVHLIKSVTYNQSPPAWEFREWCPEGDEAETIESSSLIEYTPMSYLRCHRRDVAVIEGLKKLILEKCQTSIRRDTADALAKPSHPNAQRFDDAFWRIWCFCKAFGSNKGREDDLTGQLDWLKGGLLANSQGCVATVNANLDFDMSSVLLNPPDHFAQGNNEGLTATQLFDMTEIWTCMASLLQVYQDCVQDAWDHGVFEDCGVMEGDCDAEEQMLEEWTSYLMTLGPAVILEMAEHASNNTSDGFAAARDNGWNTWTPPLYHGSRTNFLKEPASRLYQQRIAASRSKQKDPREQEKKEENRKRVASLAAEIRVRRQASSFKRLPIIDMNSERPMSMVSRASSTRSTYSQRSNSTAHGHSRGGSDTTSSSAWNFRKISPIVEDRVESFDAAPSAKQNRHSVDTMDERSILKLVNMGFVPSQARHALRVSTDRAGSNIDRAVDVLLAQG